MANSILHDANRQTRSTDQQGHSNQMLVEGEAVTDLESGQLDV